MRVCEERSDELKRRVYWISTYMPDISKCNVAAAKFFAISNVTNDPSIATRFSLRRMAENSIILSKRFDLEIVCDKMAKIYEEAKPPKNDAPDNKFNFPWGRVEHPWVLIGIEVVFWILVTSCVQLTKLYEWSKRTPVINVAAAAVGNLLAIVLLGIGKLVPKAQAGGGKMSDRLGGMLALAILFPLSCKEVQRKVN